MKDYINNIINKIRHRCQQRADEKIEKKIEKGHIAMKDERFSYENFNLIIQHFKHTVILDLDIAIRYRMQLIGKYLYANGRDGNPAIMVGYDYLLGEDTMYELSENYDIVHVKYPDIKSVNSDNCTQKLYFFPIGNGGIHTALEWSMVLNKKLLNAGVKPMLIVDNFERFYDEEYDEPLEDYYDEVFRNNIDPDQAVLILAKWLCMSLGPKTTVDVNDKILPNMDALIYTPNYFTSCKIGEPRAILVKKMMSKIRNKEYAKRLETNLLYMILQQDDRLYSHLFIDLDRGEILTGSRESAVELS